LITATEIQEAQDVTDAEDMSVSHPLQLLQQANDIVAKLQEQPEPIVPVQSKS